MQSAKNWANNSKLRNPNKTGDNWDSNKQNEKSNRLILETKHNN